MADESLHISNEQSVDFLIVKLFERLETIQRDNIVLSIGAKLSNATHPRRSMQAEIRTLEFWRSIISECLSSFFYVFIVCGAAAGAGVGASVSSVLLATALASGFASTTLTQCFMHISGAHINPAVTLATCIIRVISPLRAAMYITAQCGGGIAGAALLYGVTVPGYQGNLQAAISHSATLPAWERFGIEFILTFIVVLVYFVSMDSHKHYLGNSSLAIGAAYSACSFVSMPYLNPARSLGPSFVLNKWDNHWVYWFGPMVGGIISGIVYQYIFRSKNDRKKSKDNIEKDLSSINSDEDLNYELDIEKPQVQNSKYQSSTYRSPPITVGQQSGYCQNLYTAAPLTKFEPPEPIYGGTRSLYCRSPPPTRTNLNRSQSVYAKSNTAINRDLIPRPGPLVPAQSLYPLRVTQIQSSHLQNQNVQNQLQQRSESIYGNRGPTRQAQNSQQQQQTHHQQQIERSQDNQGFQPIYGTRSNVNPVDGMKHESRNGDARSSNRPESLYGLTAQRGRGQSAHSDDSSYGSYHGSTVTPITRNPNSEAVMYSSQQNHSSQMQIRNHPDRKHLSGSNGNPTNSDRQQTVTYSAKPPQQGSVLTHQYNIMSARQN